MQPFRIGPAQNATFADSTDHSHTGLARKLDVSPTTASRQMDKFAQDEYYRYAGTQANPEHDRQSRRKAPSSPSW